MQRRARQRAGQRPAVLPRLGLLAVLAAATGVLLAGLLLPIVGVFGLAARSETNFFVNQSTALCTPSLPQTTKIVDAHGHVIAHFYADNRRSVKLSQVPQIMQDSLLAVEDVRFYEDNGIDFKAALRALFANGSSGSVQQGGSTLTQQYVKNVLLACGDKDANHDTFSRKVREAAIALNLARTDTKSDVLQGYLNLVYFGDDAYGIGAAAERFFDEPVGKLNLTQSAFLAGLVQAPSYYTVGPHALQYALARRNVVLGQDLKYNFITQSQYDQAVAKPLGLHLHTLSNGCTGSPYPWFCSYVDAVLVNEIGKSQLLRGGLTVHTTLLPHDENAAEKALRAYVPARNKPHVEGTETLIQPSTGDIRAIADSSHYGVSGHKGTTSINYAVDAPDGGGIARGPVGSTFKMFVLAAALKEGLPLGTTISSPPEITLDGYSDCNGAPESSYSVHNAGPGEAGNFNLVTGTWDSVNTFYAQLEQRVGTCEVAKIANSLGVTQGSGAPLKQYPEMVLGEQDYGLSALDMSGAYAAIANHGEFCPPTAVTSITDSSGNEITLPKQQCTQALDPQLADTITSILEGVLTQPGATASAVGDPGRVAAAKTGTANNDAVSAFAGFVPQLAGFVWVGHTRPNHLEDTLDNITLGDHTYAGEVFGATIAGPIWKQTFEAALAHSPVEAMPSQPSEIYAHGVESSVPSVAGDTPSDAIATLEQAGFTPTVSPTPIPSDLPAGVVAKTSPPAGSKAPPGTSIVVYVSNGQAPKKSRPPNPPTEPPVGTSTHSPPSTPTTSSTSPSTPSTTPVPPPAHSPPTTATTSTRHHGQSRRR